MARTVWVLGAGFSKPVGGPLLNELLTNTSEEKLRAAFRPTDHYPKLTDDYAVAVRHLYRNHGPSAEIRNQHWSDAEAFLEALDFAASERVATAASEMIRNLLRRVGAGPGWPARIQVALKIDPDAAFSAIATAAKRLVAAECVAFTIAADPTSEKWDPYRTWTRRLASDHAIVSFNYDRVVETARDAEKGGPIVDVLPGTPDPPAGVPLYKMHGSVDWRNAGDHFERSDHKYFAVVCPDAELVIASPGPTKASVTKKLSDIWERALRRIREAEVVVFVGYRFPPSDSQARRKLVTALSGNTSKYLTVRTVLGPDTAHKDVVRLKGILEHAMVSGDRVPYDSRELPARTERGYAVRVHPLGAEDFLDLFAEGQLNQPARY